MTPYHAALARNREELVALSKGMEQLIGVREMQIQAATAEIVLLKKSKAAHAELITQIDLELNRPALRSAQGGEGKQSA